MAEEIAFENGRISNSEGLVTLTLDRVILHTVVHHSSTSIYVPNFIEIEETFCTCVRTSVHIVAGVDGTLRNARMLLPKIQNNKREHTQTENANICITVTLAERIGVNAILPTRGIRGSRRRPWHQDHPTHHRKPSPSYPHHPSPRPDPYLAHRH